MIKRASLATSMMRDTPTELSWRYELRASRMMPPAMKMTPVAMFLKPEARIPVPNFLVKEDMMTPAVMAANAAINEPPWITMVINLSTSIILVYLISWFLFSSSFIFGWGWRCRCRCWRRSNCGRRRNSGSAS